MKFELKDIYNYLLSHTFPGLLLGIEILLALYWFTNLPVDAFIVEICKTKPTLLIIIGYALSTLLGFIIDGLHHFYYEDLYKLYNKHFCKDQNYKISEILNSESNNIFLPLKDTDKLNIYTHVIDDDYYYQYEAYANTTIVMFFGFVLLILFLCIGRSCDVVISNSTYTLLLVLTAIYIFILGIVIYEATITLKQCDEEEEKFFLACLSNQNKDDSA
jgi:hypothetical protein